MVSPYYSDDAVTIYHGDCREILSGLEFDAIVTDPPYGIRYKPGEHPGSQKFGAVSGDDTDELGGWIANYPKPRVVFGADNFAHLLPPGGVWACWDKRVVETADRIYGSPFEMIWASGVKKRSREMYRVMHAGAHNADGNLRRVHPTQKPVTLMTRLINDFFPTAEVIADPFMGAGSTLRSVKNLGRKAVGIEIEEQYCEAAVVRLAQEVFSL